MRGVGAPYRARLSFDTQDRAWDELLMNHGGHYKQSSAWAEVKSGYDWSVARVTVSRGQEILGGAQVLLRRLPVAGAIGFAPRAPVLAAPEEDVRERVLDELQLLSRRCGIRILMLHPPGDDCALTAAMERRGYRPTALVVAASATSTIDLRRDEAEILARMRKKTRQHIRKGVRDGVTVREGDDGDLETFCRLHAVTGERKGFSPYPKGYFERVWGAFRPLGAARLFLAEYDGEVLSAVLVVAFGDSVWTLAVGWSGRHAARMPNEALYWSAIQWAKESGYGIWDFSSIDPRAVAPATNGEPLPEELRKTTTFFKLGFGGDVIALPSTYDIEFNPLLRMVFRSVVPPLYRSTRLRKDFYRLRWRSRPQLILRKSRA
jgi:peptidoglycan pentaglycine glycine transferase (the first glycine)